MTLLIGASKLALFLSGFLTGGVVVGCIEIAFFFFTRD